MNNNTQKLKFLTLILFVFIIILVGVLLYTTKVYNQDKDQPAVNTSAEVTSGDAASTSTASSSEQTGTDSAGQIGQTIDLKLYNYDADDYDNPKEIVNVTVDKKLYQDDITAAINKVLETTGLSLKNAELKDGLATVDLSREVAARFNAGSAGGITYTNILVMTILNMPDISKLKVTVEGVTNTESDHFSFNGIFVKSADGNKYELAAN